MWNAIELKETKQGTVSYSDMFYTFKASVFPACVRVLRPLYERRDELRGEKEDLYEQRSDLRARTWLRERGHWARGGSMMAKLFPQLNLSVCAMLLP